MCIRDRLEAEFAHNDVTTTALTDPWKKCNSPTSPIAAGNCQNQVLTSYLLHMLQTHYKTSAAILKRRDFWFGKLARGYDDYTLCDHWVASVASNNAKAKAYCELHVALDRVLWRGDYSCLLYTSMGRGGIVNEAEGISDLDAVGDDGTRRGDGGCGRWIPPRRKDALVSQGR